MIEDQNDRGNTEPKQISSSIMIIGNQTEVFHR